MRRHENGLFGECSERSRKLAYRISVLGCPKIGKSCLCARYLNNFKTNEWGRLIGIPNKKLLALRAYEGEFPKDETDNVTEYAKSHVILLCYDATDCDSFNALKAVIRSVKERAMPGAVLMVVGLKYDDKDCAGVAGNEGLAVAEENGMLFRECSAANDLGVSGVFAKVLLELQKIDGFALPISAEEANSTIPPSVYPADGK